MDKQIAPTLEEKQHYCMQRVMKLEAAIRRVRQLCEASMVETASGRVDSSQIWPGDVLENLRVED